MTDAQYLELYDSLVTKIVSHGELDGDIFYSIYEAKIKPIVYNVFSGYTFLFSSFNMEDIFQDIFVLLWKKSVPCYFLREKYDKYRNNLENDAKTYLGWCRKVSANFVTSKLRKRSLRSTGSTDDPEVPIVVAGDERGFDAVIHKESINCIYRFVSRLSSKLEMKLVWYGIYDLIYSGECDNKISANRVFLERSLGKTIGELYAETLRCIEGDLGINLSDEDKKKMENELSKEVESKLMKDIVLADLMNGRFDSKISDWVYKINKKLADEMPREVTEWNI